MMAEQRHTAALSAVGALMGCLALLTATPADARPSREPKALGAVDWFDRNPLADCSGGQRLTTSPARAEVASIIGCREAFGRRAFYVALIDPKRRSMRRVRLPDFYVAWFGYAPNGDLILLTYDKTESRERELLVYALPAGGDAIVLRGPSGIGFGVGESVRAIAGADCVLLAHTTAAEPRTISVWSMPPPGGQTKATPLGVIDIPIVWHRGWETFLASPNKPRGGASRFRWDEFRELDCRGETRPLRAGARGALARMQAATLFWKGPVSSRGDWIFAHDGQVRIVDASGSDRPIQGPDGDYDYGLELEPGLWLGDVLRNVSWSPDGRLMALIYDDDIQVRSAAHGVLVARFPLPKREKGEAAAVFLDDRRLLVVQGSYHAGIWTAPRS